MSSQVKVYFAQLRPESIINLDQPCHYEEFHDIPGYIHNTQETFDRINELYMDYMDRYTGHWSRLLEHVSKWGIVYPVVINTGVPKQRSLGSIPLHLRSTDSRFWMLCESHGGARIMAAKKLGITVPAVINDHAGLFDSEKPMTMRELAKQCHGLDQIYVSQSFGVRISEFPRVHLDISDTEYLHYRFEAITAITEEYEHWTRASSKKTINTLQRIEYESTSNLCRIQPQ